MRIFEVGFPDGPSIRAGLKGDEDFHRVEYPDVEEFLMDRRLDYYSDADAMIFFPQCKTFSLAALGHHWSKISDGHFEPKTDAAVLSLVMLKRFEKIIQNAEPKKWMLENPQGMISFFWELGELSKITHCQYGSERQKPTYIYSNFEWNPKPPCKRGSPCHVAAPRGSLTGTQKRKRKDRAKLPLELQQALVLAIENEANK